MPRFVPDPLKAGVGKQNAVLMMAASVGRRRRSFPRSGGWRVSCEGLGGIYGESRGRTMLGLIVMPERTSGECRARHRPGGLHFSGAPDQGAHAV